MARKLVKEMEDHKVSRPSHVSVSNRFTIFLCQEDYERLGRRMEDLTAKLERHLAKHVRSKRYEIPDEIYVEIVMDEDLRLGRFGILAERRAPGFVEEDLPPRVPKEPPAPPERAATVLPERVVRPTPEHVAPVIAQRPTLARTDPESGSTMVIASADAEEYGLARQTIIVRAGNRVREFTQGRVIVGRARDADFRIDNPDVSRRHAAIWWSNGSIIIEDLDSTNGTMVNGCPVSSTVVGPRDEIVIGGCRMRVEAG